MSTRDHDELDILPQRGVMSVEKVPMYPKITAIPVRKDGETIGEARVEANGEIVVTLPWELVEDIVSSIRDGFVDAFSFGPIVKPAEPALGKDEKWTGSIGHGSDRMIFASGAFKEQSDIPVSIGGLGGPRIGKAHLKEDGTIEMTLEDPPWKKKD